MKKILLLLSLLLSFYLPANASEEVFAKGVNVQLKSPAYSEGILTTSTGGVITGPNFRIQALNVCYTKKMDGETPIYGIVADGNLIIEFYDYVFIGDRLEFDFQTNTGVIYNGRSMAEPWFFGGCAIYLLEDGTYYVEEGFITTSTNVNSDWEIWARETELYPNNDIIARKVQVRILKLPVFYIPRLMANLDMIFDSPVKYSVKWGSRQGHRIGMIYEVFSWNNWKTFLRLDYRIKRGPGGGFETHYKSDDRKTRFDSITYVARDSPIIHPDQRLRYIFQGVGDSLLMDDRLSVHWSYDKISDIDMPTDYNDKGINLYTAGRTELLVRRQEDWWITNFTTRVKVNPFQTIKQELPTLETTWRPFELASTGIISQNLVRASYLDFSYGNNQLEVNDYRSTRLEVNPLLYKGMYAGPLNVTPQVGGVFIGYGSGTNKNDHWLILGKLGCSVNTDFSKIYNDHKHVITPYIQYDYLTMPTISPNDHYIFDIEDGWYRLNMLQFGVSQSLYQKEDTGIINRQIHADLYANAFFDTPTMPRTIPKVYFDLTCNSFPFMRHIINTAWDFDNSIIDHFNARTEWTVSEDIAIALEYRHRSPYDWRKADHTNFILDSYRSIWRLRDSIVSDRRDTLLLHLFYRIHPSWAFQFQSRSGWNRRFEPNYNEFEIDLLGTLRSAWNVKVSYQHREDDDRVSFYINIGIKRPDCVEACNLIPFLDL